VDFSVRNLTGQEKVTYYIQSTKERKLQINNIVPNKADLQMREDLPWQAKAEVVNHNKICLTRNVKKVQAERKRCYIVTL
jgi:hypothetical protein